MVFFLTMFVGTVSLNLQSPYEFCQWSFNCGSQETELETHATSDAVLLSVLRCATIIYFFIKLRKISKLGSAYVLGGVCICIAFAAIMFAATLIQLLRKDWAIVGDALPIFLLLIDLSRMVVLIQHALTANSFSAVEKRIAEAMQKLAPVLTLDTVIEILVIFTSSSMKVRQLQEISCFACLSVLLNYIIFTTLVPACLSVFLMASQKHSHERKPCWYNDKFTDALETEWSKEVSPLTYSVKICLCLGLFLVNGVRIMYGDIALNNDKLQSDFDSMLTLTPQQFFTVTILLLVFGRIFSQEGKAESVEIEHFHDNHVSQERRPSSISYQCAEEFAEPRSLQTCMELLAEDSNLLTDQEIISLVESRKIPAHKLETELKDPNRGVAIRRKLFMKKLQGESQQVALTQIPHGHIDLSKATAACCENTVGYVPVPVGIVGPLLLNGEEFFVPMATTEGTLLASTNRGMKAVHQSGGVRTTLLDNGMTRAPVVEFPTSGEACAMARWLEDQYNFELVKEKFEETSRYAKLKSVYTAVCGRLVYIRFKALTGDAMGMNMVSKGAEHALKWIKEMHPQMTVISLSGNFCTDKKPAAINWILGRGKTVVAEARIPAPVVKSVLKTDIDTLVRLSFCKNQLGSAMAGSIGGFNAHAANSVTALFIATGQDPAQNVEGSQCMTVLEKSQCEGDPHPTLLISCTMPCLEVATTGGGTALDAQRACLNVLGVGGGSVATHQGESGHNAEKFAQIVCATVLASELSLLSALDAGHLVQSHMKHNRLPAPDHNVLGMLHGVS